MSAVQVSNMGLAVEISLETDLGVMVMTIVFVALPDELVDVWRPVNAKMIAPGIYRLDEFLGYEPTLERWEFPPGSTVRCESRPVTGRTLLVAVSLAESGVAP